MAEEAKKCEHKWQSNGTVALEKNSLNSVASAIFCEKCGIIIIEKR